VTLGSGMSLKISDCVIKVYCKSYNVDHKSCDHKSCDHKSSNSTVTLGSIPGCVYNHCGGKTDRANYYELNTDAGHSKKDTPQSVIHLILGMTLYIIGFWGIILNRINIILTLMSIELLLLGVYILFIISSIIIDDVLGQLFGLLLLIVAGAESAIGLGIIVTYYRVRGTIRLGNYRDIFPKLKDDTPLSSNSNNLFTLPKSSISSAVVSWQILRHVPRSVKALKFMQNYKNQLIPYVKADNKNRFRF